MGRPTPCLFVEYKHFQPMKMLNQSALSFKKRSKSMTDAKKKKRKKMEEKKSIREIEKHVKNVQKPRKMLWGSKH